MCARAHVLCCTAVFARRPPHLIHIPVEGRRPPPSACADRPRPNPPLQKRRKRVREKSATATQALTDSTVLACATVTSPILLGFFLREHISRRTLGRMKSQQRVEGGGKRTRTPPANPLPPRGGPPPLPPQSLPPH